MRVFSGNCCMGDCGQPTGEMDMHDNELFVGDVVQLWHGNYIGTDCEEWLPSSGLTAIVNDRYQSFSSGEHRVINDKPRPFTMGISSVGVQGGEWKVSLVKSHRDIVNNERIPSFGFSWHITPPTPDKEQP